MAGGGKLAAWVKTHQTQAGLGAAAGGAVGIALYRRHKAKAANTNATAAVPPDATTAASVDPSTGLPLGAPGSFDSAGGMPFDPSAFGSSASDQQLLQSLSALSLGLNGIQTTEQSIATSLAGLQKSSTGGVMTFSTGSPLPTRNAGVQIVNAPVRAATGGPLFTRPIVQPTSTTTSGIPTRATGVRL